MKQSLFLKELTVKLRNIILGTRCLQVPEYLGQFEKYEMYPEGTGETMMARKKCREIQCRSAQKRAGDGAVFLCLPSCIREYQIK